MPLGGVCVFCRRVTETSMWTGCCDPCWAAKPDPWLRLEQMLESGEIKRPRGSLVPSLRELKRWRKEREDGRLLPADQPECSGGEGQSDRLSVDPGLGTGGQ